MQTQTRHRPAGPVIVRPAGSETPWQRVYAKLGMTQYELAKRLGRHRAKICRALRDRDGMINGYDQAALLRIAREVGVELSADDLVPRL